MFKLLQQIDKLFTGDGRAYVPHPDMLNDEKKCHLCGKPLGECICEG